MVSVGVVPRVICHPKMEMSLSGSSVPKKILLSSILALQSIVSDGAFVSGELLTKDCLDELKVNCQWDMCLCPTLHLLLGRSFISTLVRTFIVIYVIASTITIWVKWLIGVGVSGWEFFFEFSCKQLACCCASQRPYWN